MSTPSVKRKNRQRAGRSKGLNVRTAGERFLTNFWFACLHEEGYPQGRAVCVIHPVFLRAAWLALYCRRCLCTSRDTSNTSDALFLMAPRGHIRDDMLCGVVLELLCLEHGKRTSLIDPVVMVIVLE